MDNELKPGAMTTIITIPEDITDVVANANKTKEAWANVKIAGPQIYEMVGAKRIALRKRIKGIEEQRKGITKPLDVSKANIIALFTPVLEAYNGALEMIDKAMLDWEAKLEKDRQAEERKLREEASREQARLNSEAKAAAKEAAERGDDEEAEDIRQNVEQINVPVVVKQAPKIAGSGTRILYKYRIVDAAKIPREYLAPNEVMLS